MKHHHRANFYIIASYCSKNCNNSGPFAHLTKKTEELDYRFISNFSAKPVLTLTGVEKGIHRATIHQVLPFVADQDIELDEDAKRLADRLKRWMRGENVSKKNTHEAESFCRFLLQKSGLEADFEKLISIEGLFCPVRGIEPQALYETLGLNEPITYQVMDAYAQNFQLNESEGKQAARDMINDLVGKKYKTSRLHSFDGSLIQESISFTKNAVGTAEAEAYLLTDGKIVRAIGNAFINVHSIQIQLYRDFTYRASNGRAIEVISIPRPRRSFESWSVLHAIRLGITDGQDLEPCAMRMRFDALPDSTDQTSLEEMPKTLHPEQDPETWYAEAKKLISVVHNDDHEFALITSPKGTPDAELPESLRSTYKNALRAKSDAK